MRFNSPKLRHKVGVLLSTLAIAIFFADAFRVNTVFLDGFKPGMQCDECDMQDDTDYDTESDGKNPVTLVNSIKKSMLSPAFDLPTTFFCRPIDGIQSPPDFPPETASLSI